MQTINNETLIDPDTFPDDTLLKKVLQDSYPHYLNLLALFAEHGLTPKWRYYDDGKAWLCKVQQKQRTIAWLSAFTGFMQATVYIPPHLLPGVYELTLTQAFKDRIETTQNIGKSKPCIFEINSEAELKGFKRLMLYKMATK